MRNGEDSIAVLGISHTLSVHYFLADYSAAKNIYLFELLHLLAFFLSRCRNYFIMLILQCPALSSPFFPSLPSHPLPFLLSYILQLSLSLFSFSLPYSLFISIISIPISISSFNKYFLGTYFCHHYSETKGTSVRGQGEQLLSHTLSTDERHLKVITTLLGSPLAIYYQPMPKVTAILYCITLSA